ncbi:hypothetical protein EPUS_08697 [Endocarpon pusillum Z07020]|uniref:mannan endo-1,4-beta-mannosidase n=1 Tax=Endocarpon pusillum (strain Z07020 / HMAS-L-300199) TaxID=1263415 RepID=U1HUB2_ENDPU|nr:uncharacterized protein EPUS_08697 [Endocarpon pusillum Z07020]ERF72889.1 hypothetical protein EPUS_08697 [Endocarpon pusillum Z07020]
MTSICLAILLALALAFSPASTARPSQANSSYKNGGIDANDFVYADNLRLYDGVGVHYITGLNYWACMNLAADDSVGGNYSRLVTELDQMAAKGVNHLRVMASSEGASTPQPFRMNPPLMPAPGQYNEEIFVGLDTCLAEMEKRGMRATMTLNNEWQWSGGFGQYVSWANHDAEIPYPPSWNLSAPPQRSNPSTGWGNYTVIGVDAAPWSNYTDFANRFYTDTQAQAWYRDHIDAVVNRVNSVNGRKYNEDATIMAWQLANEPQAAIVPEEFLGPYGLELPPAPEDPLIPWVRETSEYIKSLAPKQLVSVGFEGKQGKWYWQAVHNFSTIDYGTSHCWVQNWGIYDMLNSSISNIEKAKIFARDFVANTSDWAVEIGKPIFLEEFGMARNNWENEGKEYQYLSSASTSNKDGYFQTIIGAAVAMFKDPQAAYVGTCPWAYGGVYRPETQQADQFGIVWAGDPPHESPGWYDLYDTDETMNIIYRQQQEIEAFLDKEQGE